MGLLMKIFCPWLVLAEQGELIRAQNLVIRCLERELSLSPEMREDEIRGLTAHAESVFGSSDD